MEIFFVSLSAMLVRFCVPWIALIKNEAKRPKRGYKTHKSHLDYSIALYKSLGVFHYGIVHQYRSFIFCSCVFFLAKRGRTVEFLGYL